MKPHRLALTNALVMGYGLDKQLHHVYDPPRASKEELMSYHDADYIDFLSSVSTLPTEDLRRQVETYNCWEDCPVFEDLYDFCRLYTGGSLAGARKLAAQETDIAINWSGGLHHAKRGEASGFCYVNDIVVAILELLRWHPRVLYIDIDIHHGDGVEFAFYETPRVMTVSFHKYNGEFFPGTGKLDDRGSGTGRNYTINVPLHDGIDDASYLLVFKSVINDVVETYRPSAIVLQCGADSLGCDRLGAFNLSIKGHGECVDHVRRFGVPLLVLGGGGYTIKNVSRCWTYETSVLASVTIPNELPSTAYDAFFADSAFKLHPPLATKMDNANSKAGLANIMMSVRKMTRRMGGAPSVGMREVPPGVRMGELDREADRRYEEEDRNPDRRADGGVVKRNEYPITDAMIGVESAMPPPPPPAPTKARGRASATSRKGKEKEVVESEDELPAKKPARGRAARGKTVARGGARGRGRGKKAAAAVSAANEDVLDTGGTGMNTSAGGEASSTSGGAMDVDT